MKTKKVPENHAPGSVEYVDTLDDLKRPPHERGEWTWTYMPIVVEPGEKWLVIVFQLGSGRFARAAYRLPGVWGWLVMEPVHMAGPRHNW